MKNSPTVYAVNGLISNGLTTIEAEKRQAAYGLNTFVEMRRQSAVSTFFEEFKNPLVIMLLCASAISFFSGSYVSSVLIIAIIIISSIINFVVSYKSQKSAEKLALQIQPKAIVIRDGKEIAMAVEYIVPGDIVRLEAGNIVPADGKVLASSDFFVNESSLTGESFPVEKIDAAEVYLGSGVVTGSATIEVVNTGVRTKFFDIVALLAKKEQPNEFERGIKDFSILITRVVIVMTVFVFLVNALLKHDILESLVFSLALAVGLTPELLPMIIALNVSKASIKMAKMGVIVKKLSAIESFGSMDILCTDKTGTLTEDRIALVRCVDLNNIESDEVFKLAYLTSYYHTGTKSPLDEAIVEYRNLQDENFKKFDEIPFDFERRRNSIVAEFTDDADANKDTDAGLTNEPKHILISKGAPEQMLEVTTLTVEQKIKAMALFTELAESGYRVLAVASREMTENKDRYTPVDEKNLEFRGFIAFIDPPKQDVKEVLDELVRRGITIKIVTGDHGIIAEKVATEVGFTSIKMLESAEIDALSDEELAHKAEETNIFARVTPAQKNRIIEALKSRSHVVGYMGDGINDAPSLRTADVGISVSNAIDVAKEAADIILVNKSLKQLIDGVVEGRRTFANTTKYINMAISSNFGNMFSMTGASMFLPFLPMLPVQLLLNNLLYESSQFALTFDNVDEEILNKPKPWDLGFIKKFMIVFGSISSVFDFLTFFVLYKIFSLTGSSFQTGWFIESFATQTLVIFIIRTQRSIFSAKWAHPLVTLASVGAVVVAWYIALTAVGNIFGFTTIPFKYLVCIAGIVGVYLVVVEIAKKYFYSNYLAKRS
ncbi:MAG: magnesium-translocating P-type ATPase [Candidatus Pacebacteria bacterium]|nr:magnesium-translocating P-type ATPase [Candidatus Paceibacterota bacterium]